jgi:archaellum component FlaC
VVLSPSSKVLPLSINPDETIEDLENKIENMFGKAKHFDENDKYSKNTFEDLDSEYYNLENWIKDGKLTYKNK